LRSLRTKDGTYTMKGLITLSLTLMLSLGLMAQEDTSKVKISTPYGDIIVALYNETPGHRDNILKLAREDFYNGTLFHRVIPGFMVQGGDPNSRVKTDMGSGGPGYTIPAEFDARFSHKRGAFCAARYGDAVNPERNSSGSQFYIVQGTTYTDSVLDLFEKRMNFLNKQNIIQKFMEKPENAAYLTRLRYCESTGDTAAMRQLNLELDPILEAETDVKRFAYTKEQREAYKTIGGAPHLDMQYTVYGEVIEGMDIVDKIASVPLTGELPVTDIPMTVTVVE